MLVTIQFLVPIDFNSIFFLLWKSVGAVNCLATNILWNIFLCVQQTKRDSYRFGTNWGWV